MDAFVVQSRPIRAAVLVLLTAALVLAAIGAALVGSQLLRRPSVVIADLRTAALVPWQPSPIEPAADLAAWMDNGCIAQIRERFPRARPERLLLDVRGGQFVQAVYGEGVSHGSCYGKLLPDGTAELANFGFSPPALVPREGALLDPGFGVFHHTPENAGQETARVRPGPLTTAFGSRRSPVARVEVVLITGQRVVATVGGRFFVAWWPAGGPNADQFVDALRYEGFDSSGQKIVEVADPCDSESTPSWCP